VKVISVEQCTNTHRKKKIYTKKKSGNNNVCNLPPTDLALLPHKTPAYKTHKKK